MNSDGGLLRDQSWHHAYGAWAPTYDSPFYHQHQPPPQHHLHSPPHHGFSTTTSSFGPQPQFTVGGGYYGSYNHQVALQRPAPDGRLAPHLPVPPYGYQASSRRPAMEGPAPLWGTYHHLQGLLIAPPWHVQPGLSTAPYAWQHADAAAAAAAAAGWGLLDGR